MWALVVIGLSMNTVVTIPGYSSEQTCTAGAKEVIAAITREKPYTRWRPHCLKVS
jgi:hypothetical protein